MIATEFIEQGYAVRKVITVLGLSTGSFYHKTIAEIDKKSKGIKPSNFTYNLSGIKVCNDTIIKEIRLLLALEFVDYGYLKVYHYLKNFYTINHKKVYRLMKENRLLYVSKQIKLGSKQWVKDLVPKPLTYFSYWEFDIKFMYVSGVGLYIPLLSVIDVKSRWLLGQLCQRSIKKQDVKTMMIALIATYNIPEKIIVRCDNGSQFESNLVRDFFKEKGIIQEFTKPATPEQNAHVESYHSILERTICRQYLFETQKIQLETLNRWAMFYNYQRIHSGSEYKSPYQNLINHNFKIDTIFTKVITENKCIFIPLKEKEMSNAEEQLIRDNLDDRNKSSPEIV